jgi:inward rectifier potassium channel
MSNVVQQSGTELSASDVTPGKETLTPVPQAARQGKRRRVVTIGSRSIATVGLEGGFWNDFYHNAMTLSWPAFFGCAAAVFIGLNALFAMLYSLGDKAIANTDPNLFLSHFYFSVETLATVGYGDMHPQTNYGHLIATLEIFTGMSLLAVMTGLIFTRFSRPRARFLFARQAIVTMHDGVPTLMVRLANARANMLSGASARLWLIRNEMSQEGHDFRRFHELRLARSDNPVFALSWTLIHPIDEESALYGMSPEDLERHEGALILTVSGLDEISAQELNGRFTYAASEVRWNHVYVDLIQPDGNGGFLSDYTKIHDVQPES